MNTTVAAARWALERATAGANEALADECADRTYALEDLITAAGVLLAALAEASCARCGRAFDPTDTRFDGHARHARSPWCRGCVDQCHEADAGHRCPICSEVGAR